MAEQTTTAAMPAAAPTITPSPVGSSNLLNKIKSNLQAMTQPTDLSSMYGQSGAVQSVSQAATGKLGQTAVGPARSRQAELAAVDTVQQAQKTISDKAQLQTAGQMQQMGAIQADEQFKQAMMSEEQINNREKLLNIKQDIIKEFTSGTRKLDLDRDKAKLEQLGFAARFSNEKYLNDLQNQAKLAGLGDELRFQEELMRTTFADEESLFRDSMEFRSLMQADERQFREELASMSLDFASMMANRENEQTRQQAIWGGLTGILSGVLGRTAEEIWGGAQRRSNIGAPQGQSPMNIKFSDSGAPLTIPNPAPASDPNAPYVPSFMERITPTLF